MDEEYPLMAFIANIGVAPKGDRYDRSALVHDEKGKKYKRTEKGDFIYSSNNLETGSIGLNNYGNACISPVYSIFKSKHTVDPEFMGRILLRKEFINQMVSFRQGVVYGQWKIHEDDFLNLDILVPQTTEQQKIGEFFSELDKIITLHQREYFSFDFGGGSAKNVQKTLSWEQRELSDLIEENQKPVPKPDGEYIRLGIRSHAKGTFHEVVAEGEGLDVDTMYVVESNNLIVNITFAWEEAWAITTEKDAEKLVSHRFPQYRFHHGQYPMFYQYRFRNGRMKYNLELASPGGAGRNRVLNKTEFMKIPVIIPTSYEEEKKIGDLFANLDNLITLHQHKPNKKGHDVLTVMPFKGNQRKPHYLCT